MDVTCARRMDRFFASRPAMGASMLSSDIHVLRQAAEARMASMIGLAAA
jgi:hypothetical protein